MMNQTITTETDVKDPKKSVVVHRGPVEGKKPFKKPVKEAEKKEAKKPFKKAEASAQVKRPERKLKTYERKDDRNLYPMWDMLDEKSKKALLSFSE